MSEFEPFVFLPAQQTEYTRKPGGGAPKSPIVPVTSELRARLADQLAPAIAAAHSSSPLASQGIPLAVTLREKALAKTSRPYSLLSSVDLPAIAAEDIGELITRADGRTLSALQVALESRQSKADIYAISTLKSLRIWDPVADAFQTQSDATPNSILETALERRIPLRVELFPWLSPQSLIGPAMQTFENYLGELGLPVRAIAGGSGRTTMYLEVTSRASIDAMSSLYGIRSATLTPSYSAPKSIRQQSFRLVGSGSSHVFDTPDEVRASVGVLDTGVSESSLEEWVVDRWSYDVGNDVNPRHGTFVGGLIVDSRALNSGSSIFPAEPALLFDGQVLPNGSISEDILIDRITEVLSAAGTSGPRVWNCSFNSDDPLDPARYTAFGQEMDALAKEHEILFVQSAGNYNDLRQNWPPDGSAGTRDAITSPADAVNSLTVGALSHAGGRTPVGAVSSYSRRGPGFGGQQKPDLSHYAGDLDNQNQLSGFGIQSVGPDGNLYESVGTSFSTPLVSSIAANVWQDLADGGGLRSVDPMLVKALMIHSATVAGHKIPDDLRRYHGAGVPRSESMALFDSPHTFSTIHEVELRSGVNWEKRPFPMPASVFNAAGKIRAAVSLTLCYAPIIDPAFGAEAVRTCVEPSFGRYETDVNGVEDFKGAMVGSHDWEKTLIERGKWNPVKTYRQIWKRGAAGAGDWALKLRLITRDESVDPVSQKAFVVVTVEGLDDGLPVRQDGINALAGLHYPSSLVVDSGRLRVRTGA